jgi:gluconokinase
MNDCPLVWIIMGVSGSGKTAIGRLLSEQLECDFLEGDRRHPPSNIIKMLSQNPLQDEDRRQWLLQIEDDIRRAIDRNRETVITCSALKASYRKQLTSPNRVQLVWLNVPKSELEQRLIQRSNHYMKSEMLHSQIAAFEPISPEENVITIDGLLPPIEIVNELLSQVTRLFPSMNKEWWQRCST